MGDLRHGGEKLYCLIHFHLQHIAYGFAAPGYAERLRVETRTTADFAGHFHIGQKAHFNGLHALPLASWAAACACIEAEAACGKAVCFGLQGLGKEFADVVPKADVGGGAAARGFADGGLVYFEHPRYDFVACDGAAPEPCGALACCVGFAACFGGALLHYCLHIGQQHITRQGRFSRAAYARYRDQPVQGHLHGEVLQVVQVGLLHDKAGLLGLLNLVDLLGLVGLGFAANWRQGYCAARLHGVAHGRAQVAACNGLLAGGYIARRALRYQRAAAHASAWTNVNDVACRADGVFVMLNHQQRVAFAAQGLQGVNQNAVITRVQANGGLIEHVAHALQVAAQLRCQTDALRFATA